MSISSALSSALTGLTAASRSASTVSSNLANVMTPGYGRREISLSSRAIGGMSGVTVNGIMRDVDQNTVSDRRLADSALGEATKQLEFHSRLENLLGTPQDEHALTTKLARFETSLVNAASMPESQTRLEAVSQSASDVADSFQNISSGIQQMREEADDNINALVDRLNELLIQAKDLNLGISRALAQGADIAGLEDHRQQVVDAIAEIVPVRQVSRDREAVALYTTGGAILLDGTAAEIEFSRTNVIMPHMTEANGMLSGLTINGVAVRTGSEDGALRGGALSAEFEIRDELAVEAQTELDATARDLIERFQDPTVDTTLAVGAAGLFTDAGAAFAAADEVGISGRISLNALVSQQGEGGGGGGAARSFGGCAMDWAPQPQAMSATHLY